MDNVHALQTLIAYTVGSGATMGLVLVLVQLLKTPLDVLVKNQVWHDYAIRILAVVLGASIILTATALLMPLTPALMVVGGMTGLYAGLASIGSYHFPVKGAGSNAATDPVISQLEPIIGDDGPLQETDSIGGTLPTETDAGLVVAPEKLDTPSS